LSFGAIQTSVSYRIFWGHMIAHVNILAQLGPSPRLRNCTPGSRAFVRVKALLRTKSWAGPRAVFRRPWPVGRGPGALMLSPRHPMRRSRPWGHDSRAVLESIRVLSVRWRLP
jgi:hypothetical protein